MLVTIITSKTNATKELPKANTTTCIAVEVLSMLLWVEEVSTVWPYLCDGDGSIGRNYYTLQHYVREWV